MTSVLLQQPHQRPRRFDINISEASKDAVSVSAFEDFRATYDNNRVVPRNDYIDKFVQLNASIGKINHQRVPRAEFERVWQAEGSTAKADR
jgi:hypothetical protein